MNYLEFVTPPTQNVMWFYVLLRPWGGGCNKRGRRVVGFLTKNIYLLTKSTTNTKTKPTNNQSQSTVEGLSLGLGNGG